MSHLSQCEEVASTRDCSLYCLFTAQWKCTVQMPESFGWLRACHAVSWPSVRSSAVRDGAAS